MLFPYWLWIFQYCGGSLPFCLSTWWAYNYYTLKCGRYNYYQRFVASHRQTCSLSWKSCLFVEGSWSLTSFLGIESNKRHIACICLNVNMQKNILLQACMWQCKLVVAPLTSKYPSLKEGQTLYSNSSLVSKHCWKLVVSQPHSKWCHSYHKYRPSTYE